MPNDAIPVAGHLFRNLQLAAFWRRLLDEAEVAEGRAAQIEAARSAFYNGFVAEAIDEFLRDACLMDGAGARRKGVLSGQDMADWRASYEPALSVKHHDWSVWKCGSWSQGPVQLQALQMLARDALSDLDPNGTEFVHLVTEALKLSFADRDAYYGDPDHSDIPIDLLLSQEYAQGCRAQISKDASLDYRPGPVPGAEALAASFVNRVTRLQNTSAGIGGGEPTMAHLSNRRGDTVHIDVVDRWDVHRRNIAGSISLNNLEIPMFSLSR